MDGVYGGGGQDTAMRDATAKSYVNPFLVPQPPKFVYGEKGSKVLNLSAAAGSGKD